MKLNAAKEREIIAATKQADHAIILLAKGQEDLQLIMDDQEHGHLRAHFDWTMEVGEGEVNHLALLLVFFLQRNPQIRAAFNDFCRVDIDFGTPGAVVTRD